MLQGMVWDASKYGIGAGDAAIVYWNAIDHWTPDSVRRLYIPEGSDELGNVKQHDFFPSKIPNALWWANQGADFYNKNILNSPSPLQLPVTL
jgi:hypothetical protein